MRGDSSMLEKMQEEHTSFGGQMLGRKRSHPDNRITRSTGIAVKQWKKTLNSKNPLD